MFFAVFCSFIVPVTSLICVCDPGSKGCNGGTCDAEQMANAKGFPPRLVPACMTTVQNGDVSLECGVTVPAVPYEERNGQVSFIFYIVCRVSRNFSCLA